MQRSDNHRRETQHCSRLNDSDGVGWVGLVEVAITREWSGGRDGKVKQKLQRGLKKEGGRESRWLRGLGREKKNHALATSNPAGRRLLLLWLLPSLSALLDYYTTAAINIVITTARFRSGTRINPGFRCKASHSTNVMWNNITE